MKAASASPASLPAALDDQARLPATERRARARPLRRAQLPRLPPPLRARHLRTPSSPSSGSTQSPAAGLTLPQAVLLLQPVLRCWAGRCPAGNQSTSTSSSSFITVSNKVLLGVIGGTSLVDRGGLVASRQDAKASICGHIGPTRDAASERSSTPGGWATFRQSLLGRAVASRDQPAGIRGTSRTMLVGTPYPPPSPRGPRRSSPRRVRRRSPRGRRSCPRGGHGRGAS